MYIYIYIYYTAKKTARAFSRPPLAPRRMAPTPPAPASASEGTDEPHHASRRARATAACGTQKGGGVAKMPRIFTSALK